MSDSLKECYLKCDISYWKTRKNLNIGLFGFGCVGFGLYEVLEKTPGLKANIKRICVKDKNKQRQIPSNHFTYDKNDILNDILYIPWALVCTGI